MKSYATGVNVRFFNVMIPTSPPFAARSIGRTLMERSQSPNLRTDSEAIEKKCTFDSDPPAGNRAKQGGIDTQRTLGNRPGNVPMRAVIYCSLL
jgi:hypothetical protein